MAYSSISKPSLYFNTKLWNGNGSTNAITGIGFQPDMVWNKARSGGNVNNHRLLDAVRGATKNIYPDATVAEETDANGLTAFNTDGFTMGNSNGMNNSSTAYVSWTWKANGAGSANTDGTINSTVSVNTTAEFSIVKYVGTGSGSNSTVGHGLGVKPAMIINKSLDSSTNWVVWHKDLGSETNDYIRLDTTGAKGTTTNYWNSAAPTNQVFGVSPDGYNNNKSGEDIIAYCFAEKKGYSKIGKYTGNGNADGAFVYCGFKPAFVMCKRSDGGTQNWCIMDNKRGYNPDVQQLHPNTSGAESLGSGDTLDLLSNGFKMRTTDGDKNGNGTNTYIYMAIAEEPLVANVGASIPATAR